MCYVTIFVFQNVLQFLYFWHLVTIVVTIKYIVSAAVEVEKNVWKEKSKLTCVFSLSCLWWELLEVSRFKDHSLCSCFPSVNFLLIWSFPNFTDFLNLHKTWTSFSVTHGLSCSNTLQSSPVGQLTERSS